MSANTDGHFTVGPPLAKDQAELLDFINSLRNGGVHRYISLPQLIVCGDQSSGKSSVLESIAGIRLPSHNTLSTRFATEITLKQSPKESACVQISPGELSSSSHRCDLEKFNKIDVSLSEISTLMEEASSVVGLASDSTFSNDVLKLTLSGPNQPNLTLINLPSLSHAPNKSQRKADVDLVHALVERYMSEPRSIILAVISANNESANQIVTSMAQKVDPEGDRTLGIMTVSDVLSRGTFFETTILPNMRRNLHLDSFGWHILRNTTAREKDDPQFDIKVEEHRLFSQSPWDQFPKAQVGVAALAQRLSRCLFNRIHVQLQSLLSEVKTSVKDCQEELETLGPSRGSSKEQRRYLIEKVDLLRPLVDAGLKGRYDNKYFDLETRRLRNRICELNDRFTGMMWKCGRTYDICDPALPKNPEFIHDSISSLIIDPKRGFQLSAPISSSEFLDKVEDEILKPSRGRELLTTFDPALVGRVFRMQSRKWEGIAMVYAQLIFDVTRDFFSDLLKQIAEPLPHDAILQKIIKPALDKKQDELLSKVKELLAPYSHATPFSSNPNFLKRLLEIDSHLHKGPDRPSVDRLTCAKLMHYTMAYYEVAQYTFIDNIATIAIENCLLRGLEDILTAAKVAEMEDDELESLAGEPKEVAQKRVDIGDKLRVLTDALEMCKKYSVSLDTAPGAVLPVTPRKPVDRESRSFCGEAGTGSCRYDPPCVNIDTPPDSDRVQKAETRFSVRGSRSRGRSLAHYGSYSASPHLEPFGALPTPTDSPLAARNGLDRASMTPSPASTLTANSSGANSPSKSAALKLDMFGSSLAPMKEDLM